jgi:hypothetical protein
MTTQPAIRTVSLAAALRGAQTPRRETVLPGEIAGLATAALAIPPGASFRSEPIAGKGRVYLFTGGTGSVSCAGREFAVEEVSLFAPLPDAPAALRATGSPLQALELTLELADPDRKEFEAQAARYPYFIAYSACSTYREKIKSPQTVNRTLLPEYTYPRLCIGSVQTAGPDRVAAHRHPMLEQYFYGLKSNDCVVSADGARAAFGEDVLLHIPLGSEHSVDVAAGRSLHYVWIDWFQSRSGMEWITSQHIKDK